MKWFRSNIRHGARLALFALLVQFALSFGHSHSFAQAAPLLQSWQQIDGSVATADGVAVQKQSPAVPDQDQSGDDYCAICAVVSMASTIVFATPPVLLLPQAVEFLYLTTDAEFAHLKSAGASFQPRAPPLS
ncbi:DUF2946 domain-containing protein [Bradyrhizobium arachidis]|uniref:DUF2946 domain-containing protein n=1 Tax=Bradyrhizobium arachidis TaxID=858423 RepID=UPI00216227F1|nr:DUF2946 domain-containing protein [Bradyrhizobium arachidis]UVO27424.1 DUF2946 domain-containing protein [Bradyrhizobium arachidis]